MAKKLPQVFGREIISRLVPAEHEEKCYTCGAIKPIELKISAMNNETPIIHP